MIESPVIVGYGRAATEALAEAVQFGKKSGPLSPVTVVVPSNFVGLSARRLLGSNLVISGQFSGIANVSFVTPFRLARRLSTGMLGDKHPLTNPVLGAAVRRALQVDPGPYRPVREHEATEAALASLFAELSNVDEAGLESIESGGVAGGEDVVRLYRAIQREAKGFHTENDVAGAAADRMDLAKLVAELGHVIWYLPAPAPPSVTRLIGRTLSCASSAAVVAGITGDKRADEPVWRTCYEADVAMPAYPKNMKLAQGDAIISVTDADEEVRAVLREITLLLENGTPAQRIAVFYPTPDPYVRIIEHQFADAGLLSNGPDRTRLADSVAGRTLLAALELPAVRWRRDKVMALVSGAPVLVGGTLARPSDWEGISRQAGVLRDLDDWSNKLVLYQAQSGERLSLLAEQEETGARRLQGLEDRMVSASKLAEFVAELGVAVGRVGTVITWNEKCEAALAVLDLVLGTEKQHGFWPESEQDERARVVDALSRLSALELLEPGPSTAVFTRALTSELDVARGRHGRYGEGVMYGPLSSAIGHDVDAVFVLGCAEGLLPMPRRDDAILPDRIRELSLDQLEPKSARLHHQHREFQAALSAAPAGKRTLMFPRGNLRSNSHALPSRWLLQTASSLAGHVVHATDFAQVEEVTLIESHAAGIRKLRPNNILERDAGELANRVEDGGDLLGHPIAQQVRSGLEMQSSRSSPEFTIFDGNLEGQAIENTDVKPQSASRLELWAACGFRYFLAHVLALSDRDDPDQIEDLSSLDRGKLLHHILETFIGEAISDTAPQPSDPWSEDQRGRLREITEETFTEYEQRGRTGRAVHWTMTKNDLRGVLDAFIDADNVFRFVSRATPIQVELPFGLEGVTPLKIELENGKILTFRGFADRVDTTESGQVIVSDYKSGGTKKYKDLGIDPVQAGTTLQLGLYAEAALRDTDLDDAQAGYWMLESEGKDSRLGYEWTAERRQRFIAVLTTITEGIERGVFAAAPGEWDSFQQTNANCTYCDFNTVCPTDRGDQALLKKGALQLEVRHGLALEENQ